MKVSNRLDSAGIRIVIDKTTGTPLLIFTDAEAKAVRAVANVHRFEVTLTEALKHELTADFDYYEYLSQKKAQQ